jgi:hypothetical protein
MTFRFKRLAAFSVGLMAWIGFGCGNKGATVAATKPTWQTDPAAVLKALPFLGPVERVVWKSGVVADRGAGVPGPSSYYLQGLAVLASDDLQRLQAAYDWKEMAGVTPANLEVPPSEPALQGPVLESSSLTRALPGLSVYHQGHVYLLPKMQMVYFHVVKD